MTTHTAAIAKAIHNVGDVYRVSPGPTGYGYDTFSDRHNAWWVSEGGMTYTAAVQSRARRVAELAYWELLGEQPYLDSGGGRTSGSARARLAQMLSYR